MAGCGTTGFIPVKAGDIIGLKNVQLYNGETDHDYLGFFDNNHAIIYHTYAVRYNDGTSRKDITSGETIPNIDFTEDSNNYITQFIVPDNSNIAYMRISASGVNANAVITVEEPI